MIVHLTTKTDWKAAQEVGTYRAESLETQGFIHCSTSEQILGVANSFYRGIPALVLLWIDPGRVLAEVRWEAPIHPAARTLDSTRGERPPDKNAELFPHIYGPINLEAVIGVVDFLPDAEGVFQEVPIQSG